MNSKFLCVVTPLLLGLSGMAEAGEASGAVIFRVPDGVSSRCINASTDQIWLTMRRIVLNKESRLFTVDKYAGIVITTTIDGKTGGKTAKIAFPRMIEADIESYADGHGVSIPVEFGLLEGFQLKGEEGSYTNVDFDFNVVKGKKRNAWGDALNTLVKVTKSLPLPVNPFAEGFKFFADYANAMVDSSIQQKEQDNIKQGTVKLSFSPGGQCSNDNFESTGTIAVIYASPGSEAEGFVDIGRINDEGYCWGTQLRPVFSIKFGRKDAGGVCKATTSIRNDYYGFFLNALPISLADAPSIRKDFQLVGDRKLMTESMAKDLVEKFSKGLGATSSSLKTKAVAALQWDPIKNRTPFGKEITTEKNSTLWRSSPTESVAFDFAEAIRRCEANGISSEQCLPRGMIK